MANIDTIRLLLRQTEDLLAVRREQLKRSGGNFNIFSILGMESKEVQAHSRLLYELLNPKGSHDMGDKFLRKFFEIVLDAEYPEGTRVRVEREYAFDGGQIDLLIRGRGFCYPVEVKIYAGDQELQVKRYAEFAAARAEENRVFYLTLDGREPSEKSTGGDETLNISCISFPVEIRNWLVRCGETAWAVPSVSGAIQQYIHLIDRLTNKLGDEYRHMVQNMVGSSRASFESALAIADAITDAKVELMRKIFAGIERHIGGRMEIIDANYNECVNRYYTKRGENYPYLTYKIAEAGKFTLALNFEIEGRLYYALGLVDENCFWVDNSIRRLSNVLPNKEWKEFIASFEIDENRYVWGFLPLTEDADLLPDFKNGGERYYDLFDQEKFDAMMRQVYKEIDQCIKTLKKFGF